MSSTRCEAVTRSPHPSVESRQKRTRLLSPSRFLESAVVATLIDSFTCPTTATIRLYRQRRCTNPGRTSYGWTSIWSLGAAAGCYAYADHSDSRHIPRQSMSVLFPLPSKEIYATPLLRSCERLRSITSDHFAPAIWHCFHTFLSPAVACLA